MSLEFFKRAFREAFQSDRANFDERRGECRAALEALSGAIAALRDLKAPVTVLKKHVDVRAAFQAELSTVDDIGRDNPGEGFRSMAGLADRIQAAVAQARPLDDDDDVDALVDQVRGIGHPKKRWEAAEELIARLPPRAVERSTLETLQADAMKEWGVLQAKEAYAAQTKKVVHDGDADTPALNPGGGHNVLNMRDEAMVFDAAKINRLMQDYDMSEAEVIAIRTYTADNYKYINPAVANQKDKDYKPADWMDQNRPKNPGADQDTYDQGRADEPGSKKSYYEEGALHAGMMMEAFKKLKPKTAVLHRGARFSPAQFASQYPKGKTIPYEAFVSQTTDPDVARGFANGQGGAAADATVSVMIEAHISNARDIQEFSVYKSEKELLVPPNTMLVVDDIEDDPRNDVGNPPATEWKKVVLKQV